MLAFIVNPVSGNGRGRKTWKLLEKRLKERRALYQVRFTDAPGDAVRYAREWVLGGQADVLAAVGGDGTIREAITGFLAARRDLASRQPSLLPACSFGAVPAGSGNDFVRGHGIPSDPRAALDLLLEAAAGAAPAAHADLLQLGGTVAASSISCGFDAQVALTTNTAVYKRWLNKLGLGKLAYVISVIRVLITYQPREVTVRIDGREARFDQVWLAAVSNLPYYGGGLKINPEADPGDGLATVCVAFGITRWQLLRLFPLVFTGKHIGNPAVRFFTGRTVEIFSAARLPLQADGDPVEEVRNRVEVLPFILPVIKPGAPRFRRSSSSDPDKASLQAESAG